MHAHIARPPATQRLAAFAARGALALLLCAPFAQAADPNLPADIGAVQDRWAEIKYDLPKAEREAAFAALAQRAEAARKAHPGNAPALIWEGIVLSTWAGEKGGLGALGLVKRARADFEAAIKLAPDALDGAAYTSLGTLYAQVPGWPIAFGDDDQARRLLRKGLEIDPNGLDANYFYADYLHAQGDEAGAAAALEKALAAPARAGRATADRGRRKEVQSLLGTVRAELARR